MATVTGLTKDRMLAIEAASVVDGNVDAAGNLILTKHNGEHLNAGHVRGEDATALLGVTDTPTIDLTLSGAGTQSSPWDLRAQVKDLRSPVEKTGLTLTNSVYGQVNKRWYVKGQDGVTYGPYPYSQSYRPTPGDKVWLEKDGFGDYVIGGSKYEWNMIPDSENTRLTYDDVHAYQNYNSAQYQVRNGFVSLRGMLVIRQAGSGVIIGQLPVGSRPDNDIAVKINNGDIVRTLYIRQDGAMLTGAGTTTGGYYSLDGIMFPAAGRATWTYVGDPGSGLSFANGWTNYTGTAFGRAGLWRDEFGFVWSTGLLAGGNATQNTNMITITNPDFYPWTGVISEAQQHIATVSAENLGGLNISTGTTRSIRCGAGIANNNAWISLGGIAYLTDVAYANPAWITHPDKRAISGGWVNLENRYPTFAYLIRDDGMVITRGMLANGSMGSAMETISDIFLPDKTLLLSNLSSAGFSRMDIIGRHISTSGFAVGAMVAKNGGTPWFSVDMLRWFPG